MYDVIEAIYTTLLQRGQRRSWDDETSSAEHFVRDINKYFRKSGIGWQLIEGLVQARGPEAFETTVTEARQALEGSGRQTAVAGDVNARESGAYFWRCGSA